MGVACGSGEWDEGTLHTRRLEPNTRNKNQETGWKPPPPAGFSDPAFFLASGIAHCSAVHQRPGPSTPRLAQSAPRYLQLTRTCECTFLSGYVVQCD